MPGLAAGLRQAPQASVRRRWSRIGDLWPDGAAALAAAGSAAEADAGMMRCRRAQRTGRQRRTKRRGSCRGDAGFCASGSDGARRSSTAGFGAGADSALTATVSRDSGTGPGSTSGVDIPLTRRLRRPDLPQGDGPVIVPLGSERYIRIEGSPSFFLIAIATSSSIELE